MAECPAIGFNIVLSDLRGPSGSGDGIDYPIPDGAETWQPLVSSMILPTGTTFAYCYLQFYDAEGHYLGAPAGFTLAASTTTIPHLGLSLPIPAGATIYRITFVVNLTGIDLRTASVAGQIMWTGACTAAQLCQYGTEMQAGVAATLIITIGVVAVVGEATGAIIPATIVSTLLGLTLNTSVMCSGLPPPIPPAFAGATQGIWPLTPSVADVKQYFEYLAWPLFCKCSDGPLGEPPPIPPPLPPPYTPPTDPGGNPLPPPIIPPATCTGTDLCSFLDHIDKHLTAQDTILQTILQKVGTAASAPGLQTYRHGTVHAALEGQGELTVSGILGLSVSFSAVPAYLGSGVSDPPARFYLGRISAGTGDGWERSQHLVHNPTLLLVSPLTTKVGYTFGAGVVASITELVPTPA